MNDSAGAISFLFVPGSRPERFDKALSSGADAVIIDLEDAVAPAEKDAALDHLLNALESSALSPLHVRINAAGSPWFERDVAALGSLSDKAHDRLAGVVVPKTEDAASIASVRAAVGTREVGVIALIESAAGVANARAIAASGITRFAVGAADLSVDLDVEITSATIDWVYAQIVVESRLAGLAGPIASPPFELRDLEAVEREAGKVRALGATGQLCIHPGQVRPIHSGFLPDERSVEWARRVVRSGEVTDGAVQVGGQMIDKPVRERAERILARAGRR